MRFLSMAALALVGAVMTGCSGDDNIIDTPQQPENKSKVVTLTTTVSMDGGATTRALTATGVKTFATGDQIALIYTKNGGTVTKVESEPLPAGDYGKTATFTFTLDDPDRNQNVTYIYPAAMAGATDVDYTNLNSQEGTLTDLGSKYDLATYTGAWSAGNLPTATLENQLAILAITLKDVDGTNGLNSTTTGLTIEQGTNTYTVTRSGASDPIYVAIRPITSPANISITATAGTKNYIKFLTGKTYAINNGYNVSWKMATVGDVILHDGTLAKAGTTGAVATIFYVGSETAEEAYGFNHGLALAMSDAYSGKWATVASNAHPGQQHSVSSIAKESGLQWNSQQNNDTYPAVKYAILNNSISKPTGDFYSDWFLPTAYQWNLMMGAVGGHVNLRASADLDYTPATGYYWSSTESSSALALRYYFGDGNWSSNDKVNNTYHVRSCLAF